MGVLSGQPSLGLLSLLPLRGEKVSSSDKNKNSKINQILKCNKHNWNISCTPNKVEMKGTRILF
jgi:hypothetical protein